ncbi:MAG: biotin/lipoyl-containing protein [Fimbriiglobus sp.]
MPEITIFTEFPACDDSAVVVAVRVVDGQQVAAEDVLLEIEFTKVTMALRASVAGVVRRVCVAPQMKLRRDDPLIVFEPVEPTDKPYDWGHTKPPPPPQRDYHLLDTGFNSAAGIVHHIHVQNGDDVVVDQLLMSVEFDKRVEEFRAPDAGKITLHVQLGETIRMGQRILSSKSANTPPDCSGGVRQYHEV